MHLSENGGEKTATARGEDNGGEEIAGEEIAGEENWRKEHRTRNKRN